LTGKGGGKDYSRGKLEKRGDVIQSDLERNIGVSRLWGKRGQARRKSEEQGPILYKAKVREGAGGEYSC